MHIMYSIFEYLQAISGKLFIGRDLFGRRSLLWARNQDALFISSVADETVWANLLIQLINALIIKGSIENCIYILKLILK